MAVHKNLFSPNAPLPDHIKDGDEIIGGNISQDKPDTDISSLKNLTFRGVNMTRCRINPSWRIDDCNTCPHPKEPEPDYAGIALKESIKQEILDKYAAEFDKQLADMKAEEIDPKSLEASVIAAVSAKPVEGKP